MTAWPAAANDQAAVVEFLSRSASYGLRDGEVERIESHCSIVFLAAGRAYKLKRAIRCASLDYTRCVLRQAACTAELALNRRTAPELYLGVRSITRDPDGTLVFNAVAQPRLTVLDATKPSRAPSRPVTTRADQTRMRMRNTPTPIAPLAGCTTVVGPDAPSTCVMAG